MSVRDVTEQELDEALARGARCAEQLCAMVPDLEALRIQLRAFRPGLTHVGHAGGRGHVRLS